jgi:hypothetical protein
VPPCDASCLATQAIAIEAIGYIAKGVYQAQREELLVLKRNAVAAAPFRPHSRTDVLLFAQGIVPMLESYAGAGLITSSTEEESSLSTNTRLHNYYKNALSRAVLTAGASVLIANASTAFSIDVPTEKTKTMFLETGNVSEDSFRAGSENWQFLVRRSAQVEAAQEEARAANAKKETEFTSILKHFSGTVATRIGLTLALSQTEVLTVKRQLETRLLKRFDLAQGHLPADAPLDLARLLRDSGIDSKGRLGSLAAVLEAVDGRDRKEIDPALFNKEIAIKMKELIAWNIAQSERLWASNDPTDRELSKDYLLDARKIEIFVKRLNIQRALLKEEK